MNKNKNFSFFKILSTILCLAIIVYLIIYFFPIIQNLSTTEGQVMFKQKVESSGFLGFLMLFGLQFLQIFLVVLPGEPLEVLAGMCYGTIGGTAFILFTTFVTTTIVYFLVRKCGKKLLYNFFDQEKIDKIENSKLFKDPNKIEKIFIILFLITGTPKDLLTYIGGLCPIKPWRFILIATFCRIPSIISSTIAGSNLSNGNWQVSIIVYIVTFIITFAGMFIFDKFDKTKITKMALETIK